MLGIKKCEHPESMRLINVESLDRRDLDFDEVFAQHRRVSLSLHVDDL